MKIRKQSILMAFISVSLGLSSFSANALLVNAFGENGTETRAALSDSMVVSGIAAVDCNQIQERIVATAQNEALAQQDAVQQVMANIDFSPMINCQEVVGGIAQQILSSGGSFGFAGAVISQVGGSYACNYSPINRGLRQYNDYARSATKVFDGAQSVINGASSGNVSQAVGGATSVGATTGVISNSTASTIKKTTNAGVKVYDAYETKNVDKAASGSETIVNTGSKYLTGGN